MIATSYSGLALLIAFVLMSVSESFLTSSRMPSTARKTSLRLVEDDQEVIFGGSGTLDGTDEIDSSLMTSLKQRQQALDQGIGKRYVTRTQKGFLNVHYEPTNPHHNENVVGQLEEGQIVTSTGPSRGFWVPHDGGGWSISKYGGFTWLEPIDE